MRRVKNRRRGKTQDEIQKQAERLIQANESRGGNSARSRLVRGIRDRYLTNIDELPSQRKLNAKYNQYYGKEETPEKKRVMDAAKRNVTQKKFSQSRYMRQRTDRPMWGNEDYKRGYNGGLAVVAG